MTGKNDSRLETLFFFGRPLAPIYGVLMALRSKLYSKNIFKQHRLDVPVISVGNLILGGTGKTPLVLYIANLLQQHLKKPAILSRGYKGTAAAAINVVSDPTAILLDAAAAGDEPFLLAEKLPGIPVITGKKRFITGRFAINAYGVDVLILDDGFQHMALARDLDLVLFSARKRLGNSRVLPAGELREPVSALNRAHAFIITDADATTDRETKEFIHLLASLFPEKPAFTATYSAADILQKIQNGQTSIITRTEAAKLPLYGFCGIARPESFINTLETAGMRLTGFQEFSDHHIYTTDNIRSLIDKAKNSGAAGLITTAKDQVKLRHMFLQDFPLLMLPIVLHMANDFDRFLMRHLAGVLNL